MTGKPTAVLFDLGGVLFKFDPDRRVQFIADSADLPAREVNERVFNTDYMDQCERGDFDGPASHAEFCRLLGVDWTYEIYEQAILSAFGSNDIMIGLAREVAANCSIGCLSNNGETVKTGLATLAPELFALLGGHQYFSYQIAARKPSTNAFNILTERWGKQPGEILFVDDSIEHITVAAELGFVVHRFTDTESLETDFRSFGLL
jgi:FMN phosphatase YigB (HAD superfamily)